MDKDRGYKKLESSLDPHIIWRAEFHIKFEPRLSGSFILQQMSIEFQISEMGLKEETEPGRW